MKDVSESGIPREGSPKSGIPPEGFPKELDEYKQTLVRKGVTIGANSTIVCGVTIGCYAFVGAGAVVTKDIPDYALVVGNPAQRTGWMSEAGVKLDFPNQNPSQATCSVTGATYRIINGENVLQHYAK